MTEYKPSWRTQLIVLATFLVVVLPAVGFAVVGYSWFIEHVLKLDTEAKPEGIMDRLFLLVAMLPMVPVMLVAIFVSGFPWMYAMARLLSWADLQYFTNQKGPRWPILSDWLDRIWLRMIEAKRPKAQDSRN